MTHWRTKRYVEYFEPAVFCETQALVDFFRSFWSVSLASARVLTNNSGLFIRMPND